MGVKKLPSTRADYAHFMVHNTRWNDNDVYGHVNNVVHYSIFDTTVNAWLIKSGLLVPRQSEQIGLVVETGCRYFGEMSFPDEITAGISVAHIGTSSVRYELGLFRNDEPSASAEGWFVHVYVDAISRRPTPLAPKLRTALEGLQATSVSTAGA